MLSIGMLDTLSNIKESLASIADFIKNFIFYMKNPLEALQQFVIIMLPFAHFCLLFVCAFVIIMAIMGNRKGLKAIPVTFVAYLMMRVLSVVL